MNAGGANAEPEEEVSSSRSNNGCDSEKWETSEDEARAKSKNKVLPDGFLDPLPHQKSSKLPRLSNMTSGPFFRKTKMVISRDGSSSRTETDKCTETSTASPLPDSQANNEFSVTVTSRHSVHSQQPIQHSDGIWMIDQEDTPVRRRGRTTCADIQSMPPGTRVLIEVNDAGIPCNIPESILLGSYLGVISRNPMLAPINFSDWRNKEMKSFKKKMIAEVEEKFAIPGHIRSWVLQSLGVKWRNYKTSLKAEYFDSRPINEIMEAVPNGVDASQWCQLVVQWSEPKNKERAKKNAENAKKQTCPHTMGRVSSVRRQNEMVTQDRLLLWKVNRLHKDGSWSSEDARLKWVQACEILVAEGLTPEDGNVEANERVFSLVMGPEHGGRVRVAGFGVTPTKYFPQSTTTAGQNSKSSVDLGRMDRLEKQLKTSQDESRAFQNEVRSFMQKFRRSSSS